LLDDEQKTVLFDGQIPLFIAIIINNSVFGPVGARVIPEIKSSFREPFGRHPHFSADIQIAEDAPVPAQDTVDRSHILVAVAVAAVVIHAPALIGAEFLVRPAHDGCAALQAILNAVLFHHAGEIILHSPGLQQNHATENLMIFKKSFTAV
jgi:hypothetical protein